MIEIRPATEADRVQILTRMEEVYGRTVARRARRLWRWQWHLDPRLPEPGYRGVVAVHDGEIIANLATIPAGLHIHGEPVTAWWFVDVLVHWGRARAAMRADRAGARRGGGQPRAPNLAKGLAGALFDHPSAGPIQLGKHIADGMAAIGDRLGFVRLAETGSQHRRVSLREPLGRWLGTRVGDLAGAVFDPALGPSPRPRLPVEPLEGPFDTRFDNLWGGVKDAYPAICRRDAAVLNWRYLAHPEGGHCVLTLTERNRLRGYCVLRAFDREGRRRGKLLDLLTAPGDDDARHALLAAAIRELRRQRVERVECFYTGTGMGRLLAELGFTPRTTKAGQPRAPLMVRGLPATATGIWITQGDGDGG